MLHQNTVEPGTLGTLKRLMQLTELLEFFKRKYQNDDIGYVVMSLTYFEDAENQDDPVVFQKMTWDDVKNKVRTTVLDYMKRQNL